MIITSAVYNQALFKDNTNIISVDCNNSEFVNNAMTNVFYNCTSLTNVTNINNNVTSLESTFYNCTSLTTIPTLPTSIKNMASSFDSCTNLSGDIIIPSNTITNAENCFANTNLQKDVYIPYTDSSTVINKLNGTINGTLINMNGIFEGFSHDNYIVTDGVSLGTADNWEIVCKVVTPSNVYSSYYLICGDDFAWSDFGVREGLWVFYLSSTGNSWNIASNVNNGTTVKPSTEYLVKFEFTGTTYNMYVSENDGESWVLTGTFNSSTHVYNCSRLRIGNTNDKNWPWNKYIDLNNTYIKVNNNLVWKGTNSTDYSEIDIFSTQSKEINGTIVGNLTNNDFVVSNFSASTYINTNQYFNPGNNTWEIHTKCKTGSDVSSVSMLIGTTLTGTSYYPQIYIANNRFEIAFSYYGNNWNIVSTGTNPIRQNTKYEIKIIFDGASYKLLYKTENDNDYIIDIETSSSTPIYTANTDLLIGYYGANSSWYWKGEIDLKETYIKINNQIWWKGTKLTSLIKPNGNFTGNLINTNNIISNFGRYDYITENLSDTFSAGTVESFEICMKVTTPSSWTSNGRILNWNGGSDSQYGPYIEAIQNSSIGLRFYTGTYYAFMAKTNPISNKTYWLKWVYDGTNIYSYNKEEKNDPWNLNETTACDPSIIRFSRTDFTLGCRSDDHADVCVWNGSIDLTECYIKINNTLQWKGTYEEDPSAMIGGNIVGTLQIENGIMKDQTSGTNYINIGMINVGDYSWEVCTKVKTGNNVSNEYVIFNSGTDQHGFRVGLCGTTSRRWEILVAQNGNWINTSSHAGSYEVQPNTEYWLKAGYDGVNNYYLRYSLDGINWNMQPDVSYSSSSKLTPYNSNLYCRNYTYVDLSQTNIKINNIIVWEGLNYKQTDTAKAFINANYDNLGTKDNVYLHNLATKNKEIDISDYTFIQEDDSVILTRYIGSNTTTIIPNIERISND